MTPRRYLVDRSLLWPPRPTAVPVDSQRDKPVAFILSRVRRFTALAARYLVIAAFHADRETREQAGMLVPGAVGLALDTADAGDLIWHPASRPLVQLVRLFTTPRPASAAAVRGARRPAVRRQP